MYRTFIALMLLALSLSSGCSHVGPFSTLTKLDLTLTAGEALNPDLHGRPSPVVVHLLELEVAEAAVPFAALARGSCSLRRIVASDGPTAHLAGGGLTMPGRAQRPAVRAWRCSCCSPADRALCGTRRGTAARPA